MELELNGEKQEAEDLEKTLNNVVSNKLLLIMKVMDNLSSRNIGNCTETVGKAVDFSWAESIQVSSTVIISIGLAESVAWLKRRNIWF